MNFVCKKAENCFSDSQTYEYVLPSDSQQLLCEFETLGMLSVNSKFRRPVFSLELPDGTQIKGLLSEHMIKASFPNDDFEHSKAEFELCLRKIALQNN